ncbi:RNA polymerase III subunit C82 [Pichia californica]|uniref:DNA-directed RNA polymerase III subunit RPC3 n=1 Tax=Pichia californica TaxID=460514 RepID=A0A9P6WRF8_9ASCO|nr:RNA polymerase III subunit C82 [[Candida] californica]KAG0691372.1 RNA polymerase III subunit C82 [[Candida] californica]
MSGSTSGTVVPSELPMTAKTQSPSCFLHCVILRAYVGEQAAYIYSCLHSQRKMSLQQLSQKSGIKGINLKKILVTLIQLGCVVYITNNNVNGKSNIFYCHNEEGCWKLTYIDEIVRHVREKFGQIHASVIQNVILRGHLTIGSYVNDLEIKSEVDQIEQAFFDLVEDQWLVHAKELDFKPLSETFRSCIHSATREFVNNNLQYTKGNDIGGDSNPKFKSAGMSQLKKTQIIKDLAKEKFMKLYYDTTGKDKLNRAGKMNQINEIKPSGESALSSLFDDDDDVDEYDVNEQSNGTKLLRRLNGNVPLTVSFDRFLKYERDVQLVSLSKHRIGNVTAKIYNIVLKRIEKNSREVRTIEGLVDRLVADASVGAGSAGSSTSGYDPSTGHELMKRLELRDQQKGLNFGAVDILKELSLSNKYSLTKDDLLGTIYDDNDDEDDDNGGEKMSKKRKLESRFDNESYKKTKLSKIAADIKTFDDEDDEEIQEEDNGFDLNNNSENGEVLQLILQHLKLLTIDKKISFLIETSPGNFYVPFTMLQSQIPNFQVKQIVKTIFGTSSLRILNCIEEKRLIEEKNIAKSVLMKEGDVRKIIATLTKFGLVEIQEIPRTADRSAMRGIFAFKINKNYQRGKKILSKCLMFNMGEVLDQMEQVKMENKILLDKISREDVRGREVELLLGSELNQLKTVIESEKIGLAKFIRLRSMGEMIWFADRE